MNLYYCNRGQTEDGGEELHFTNVRAVDDRAVVGRACAAEVFKETVDRRCAGGKPTANLEFKRFLGYVKHFDRGDEELVAVLCLEEVDKYSLTRAVTAVGNHGIEGVFTVNEVDLLHTGLALDEREVVFAHVADEEGIVLPVGAEDLREGRALIGLKERADEGCGQNIALARVTRATCHCLTSLDEGHRGNAAVAADLAEVDGEGVEIVVFNELANCKTVTRGFSVCLGIYGLDLVEELRVFLDLCLNLGIGYRLAELLKLARIGINSRYAET